MNDTASADRKVSPTRLRLIMLLPLLWMLFAVILPDFALRVSGERLPTLRAAAAAIGMVLLCASMVYLLSQARKEKALIVAMFTATVMLLISQTCRTIQSLGVLESAISPMAYDRLNAFDNLLDGFGIMIIAFAFFNTIIEMLAARQRLMAEHERLIEEVARRERIEIALRENEAVLESINASALDAVILMDNDGNVSFWNPSAERILGYAASEIIGKPLHDTLAPPSYRMGYEKGMREWRSSGTGAVVGRTVSLKAMRKDGREIDIELSLSSVQVKGKWVAVGILRDVTERLQSERLIADQRVRMVQAARLSALGTMASGMAHEINNPLATISVASQQLADILQDVNPDRALLQKVGVVIGRNVERISRIVRGLKMLSRDGILDPFTATSMSNLVLETLELCQARFAAHGISLVVPEVPASLEIECRPHQVSQVLLNLLNNAHDAVEDLSEKWVRLDIAEENGAVSIAVTDSGPGLPPEIREKALVPFFTTKEPGKGVGLGLSISVRLVAEHHGELFIDPANPHTCFVVRLPRHQPASENGHAPEASES